MKKALYLLTFLSMLLIGGSALAYPPTVVVQPNRTVVVTPRSYVGVYPSAYPLSPYQNLYGYNYLQYGYVPQRVYPVYPYNYPYNYNYNYNYRYGYGFQYGYFR